MLIRVLPCVAQDTVVFTNRHMFFVVSVGTYTIQGFFSFFWGGQLKHFQVGGSPSKEKNPSVFFFDCDKNHSPLSAVLRFQNLPEVTVTESSHGNP